MCSLLRRYFQENIFLSGNLPYLAVSTRINPSWAPVPALESGQTKRLPSSKGRETSLAVPPSLVGLNTSPTHLSCQYFGAHAVACAPLIPGPLYRWESAGTSKHPYAHPYACACRCPRASGAHSDDLQYRGSTAPSSLPLKYLTQVPSYYPPSQAGFSIAKQSTP